MALQINREIETLNKGIVPTPYLRIESYRIDKILGYMIVQVALFSSKADADTNKFIYSEDITEPLGRTGQTGPIAVSIGYNDESISYPVLLEFPLTVTEEVSEDIYETQEITNTITYSDFDENGDIVEKTREETTTHRVKTGTRTITKSRIDLSVIDGDPYGWAYTKTKIAYEQIFGVGNLTDC